MKTFLFYFGHPAQYLFSRETIKKLNNNHKVILLIKTKDVLEDLVRFDNLEYINILPEERGNSKTAIIKSLLKRIIKIIPIVIKRQPSILISTDASIAIVGKLFGKHVITIIEDDYSIIKSLADLTYSFTSSIFCPNPCTVGKWEHKKVGYYGYMKLSYLHPNIFIPSKKKIESYGLIQPYALIRIARLNAHHDYGIKGLDKNQILDIISYLESRNIKPLISAESGIDEDLKNYELRINVNDIHHVLSFAQILVCDSQSMSLEASMLGIPSIRYSSFAGKISVLEELEHKYKLTYGIKAGEYQVLKEKLDALLNMEDRIRIFSERRSIMLKEMVNVSELFTWFIENYPKSKEILRHNREFQFNFR